MYFAFSLSRFARLGLLLAALSAGFAAPALADSADGTITQLDESNNTLTLSDGKTYKLPGEFDYSGFHVGQKVSVFYDTDPSGSYVTDIEVQGAKAADTDSSADGDNAANDSDTAKQGGAEN